MMASASKGMSKEEALIHCSWGYKLVQPLLKSVCELLQKARNRTAV